MYLHNFIYFYFEAKSCFPTEAPMKINTCFKVRIIMMTLGISEYVLRDVVPFFKLYKWYQIAQHINVTSILELYFNRFLKMLPRGDVKNDSLEHFGKLPGKEP